MLSFPWYLPIIHLACIFKWARKLLSSNDCSFTLMIDILMQICASILGNEWSPVLSVVAVCVTLQSMLASCKVRRCCPSDWPPPLFTDHIYRLSRRKNGWCLKVIFCDLMKLIYHVVLLRPTDNDRYVRNAPENPKKVREPY